MPVNSITPSQPAQAPQAIKKSDIESSRKQAEIQEDDKVKSRKDAADQNARLSQAQNQKTQETKASVNTNGQKVGSLINITA
jgi:hypothetical protein